MHQVRPLQRYTKVQAAGLQPDSHDSRVLHLHAQRHGGLYVTLLLHKFKVNGIYLKFISYLCNGFEAVAYHTSSCCLCERASAVLLVEIEATRFCLVSRIWKIQIRARRSTTVHVYTWACRLMSSLTAFQSLTQRRGIHRPTFRIDTRQFCTEITELAEDDATCEGRMIRRQCR